MGMAAGQARLLSITSRMSDNELRAQIINNNKMRLATESSQVSEAYVNALNQAQLMFTNYDADNNTSYQQLTFNSLTAYNPYNNQYGISNASGQILVSEKDALNYQNADGSLEKFVGFYGLTNDTTYFSSENLDLDENGHVLYMSGVDEETGEAIYNSTGMTPEQLKSYYEGISGSTLHPGYMTTIASEQYYNYQNALQHFDTAYTAYAEAVTQKMTEIFNNDNNPLITTGDYIYSSCNANKPGTTDKIGSVNITTLKEYINTILPASDNESATAASAEDTDALIHAVNGLVNACLKYAPTNGNPDTNPTEEEQFFKNLSQEANSLIRKGYGDGNSPFVTGTETQADGTERAYIQLTDNRADNDSDIEFRIYEDGTVEIYETDENGTPSVSTEYTAEITTGQVVTGKDTNSNAIIINVKDASGVVDSYIFASYTGGEDGHYTKSLDPTSVDTDNDSTIDGEELYNAIISNMSQEGYLNVTKESNLARLDTQQYVRDCLESILKRLESGVYLNWNVNEKVFKPDPDTAAYQNYVSAAEELLQVYGFDISGGFDGNGWKDSNGNYTLKYEEISNLIDLDQIWIKMGEAGLQENFQAIYDVEILDRVFNTYGEPQYTWIDTNNGNENGEAKYQWYANLFERMGGGTKHNYQVIQDGLASSSEWMQFALESGLVTMEQVDSNSTWNTLMYSNCSDITEQTNNAAVTIAEAEYNAAMKKIENKDKKYDLELKNIDTEHNSLQTEYDSIKSAIDKNIERTFKIYS